MNNIIITGILVSVLFIGHKFILKLMIFTRYCFYCRMYFLYTGFCKYTEKVLGVPRSSTELCSIFQKVSFTLFNFTTNI